MKLLSVARMEVSLGQHSSSSLLQRLVWRGAVRMASVTVKQGLLLYRQAVPRGAEQQELFFSQLMLAVILV